MANYKLKCFDNGLLRFASKGKATEPLNFKANMSNFGIPKKVEEITSELLEKHGLKRKEASIKLLK